MADKIAERHAEIMTAPLKPMPKSNYGLDTKQFKPMTGQDKKAARTEVDKALEEYKASGKTVTKCKTTSTPAWLTRRKKREQLNIVKTEDLLKESTS